MAENLGKPRRWLRWTLIGLAVVVVLPVGGLAVFLATFDAEAQKPRIKAAVEQATGRALTLSGPIGVKFSLTPTLTVDGVALANMPGGSQPEMLSMRRAEVELALLPLLSRRVEVRRLVLVAPDILLETDKAGQPNWAFAPAGAASAEAPSPAAAPSAAADAAQRQLGIQIDKLAMTEGRLTWRDGVTGRSRVLAVPRFQADGGAGPMRFGGDFTLDGAGFTLTGQTGPLAALLGPAPAEPWPVTLTLESAGARLAAEGSIAQPRLGQGWRFAVTALVPELAKLAPLVPDAPLPPLRGIDLAATVADAGAGQLPEVSALRLKIGASPLDAVFPGLRLTALDATLPRQDQPLALQASGTLGDVPLALSGSLGAPALLLPGGPGGPWPLDLAFRLATAEASVKGSIAHPARLEGVDLALSLRVPELAALSGLAGTPLPPVRDLVVETKLAERTPGFAGGAVLRQLRVTSSAFDAAGDLTYVIGQRQGISGTLASTRLDLDALQPPPAQGAPGAPGAPAAPSAAAHDGRVIPDIPLPLEALRLTDSNLRWTIGTLQAGGVAVRDVQLTAVIEDGKARFDLPTATLPGGRIAARLGADVTVTPPSVEAAIFSEGLDLPALAAALHAPGGTSGRLEVDVNLRGRGSDLRAVAATATGQAALALTSGQIEQGQGSMLSRAFDELRGALPQLSALAGRRIAVACAATRFTLQNGIAESQALLVDSNLGKIGGGGSASLRDETLSMRLQLDLSVPVPGVNLVRIRAPLPVGGRFSAPRPDYNGVAGGLIGTAEGLLRTPSNLADGLLGALGGPRGTVPGAGGGLPDCGPVLATVRGGRAGPVPASQAPAAPATPAERPSTDRQPALPAPAQQLLRGLLGR
jgi:AsmA protein